MLHASNLNSGEFPKWVHRIGMSAMFLQILSESVKRHTHIAIRIRQMKYTGFNLTYVQWN